MEILKGRNPAAWVATIYGVPAVGKSTLATFAPKPVFIDCEGGLDRIDCERTAKVNSWPELYESLRWAISSDYQTIVIDSLSAVEEILTKKILDDTNKNRDQDYLIESLSDKTVFAYGSGFELLKSNWALFAKLLFKIKDRGKNVLCIGHEIVEKVENPSGENYDRFTLAIHKKSAPLLIAKMDAVFFAHYEKLLQSKESSGRKVAVGTKRRLLQAQEKPDCVAKSRFDLEDSIDFSSADLSRNFFEGIK